MSFPAESDGSMNEAFKTFPLSKFPVPPQPVVVIDSDMSISEACRVLSDNKMCVYRHARC